MDCLYLKSACFTSLQYVPWNDALERQMKSYKTHFFLGKFGSNLQWEVVISYVESIIINDV